MLLVERGRWPTLSDSFAGSQSCQAGQRKSESDSVSSGHQIGEEVFDQVILATGAWLRGFLEPFRI